MKIKEYGGNKSQIMLKMIDNKLEKNEIQNLPKYRNDKAILTGRKKVEKLGSELKKAKANLLKREKELGIEWNRSYSSHRKDEYVISGKDRIPEKIKVQLQNASDLWALGKRAEANKLWDKLIEKYSLGSS